MSYVPNRLKIHHLKGKKYVARSPRFLLIASVLCSTSSYGTSNGFFVPFYMVSHNIFSKAKRKKYRFAFELHTMRITYVLTLLASAVSVVSATGSSNLVSTDKHCYHVGEDIEVSFVDAFPHPQDWVAIYEGDADPHDLASRPLLWLYTCCDQHCNFAVSSDTLTFGSGLPDESSRGHFPLPAGNYKAFLARNLHLPYEALAESLVFSISNSCPTIIDVLEEKGNFQRLLFVLEATGFDVPLDTFDGPFTLFAPNDHAFDTDTFNFLLANANVLTDILLYHVLAFKVLSTDLVDGSLTTYNNDDIHIDVRSNGNIVINGNTLVIHRDLLASNGVVHEINKVLIPPPALALPSVTTDKDCYHVAEDIDVSFISGGDAHPLDFVAIYESTADVHNLGRTLLWLYTCGDQHCNFAVESGTLTFGSGPPSEGSRAHFPLPAGHYKAILARGTHRPYEALAVSDVFSINTFRHPCY
jgi:uncharacterized surface protein with fasciclin (FAS1) repeats